MTEYITYGEWLEQNIPEYANKYKPETMALLLISIGGGMISHIGLNHFNNRYISIPFIILTCILYLLAKREQCQMRTE